MNFTFILKDSVTFSSIILLLLCLESKFWFFNIYNKIKITALTTPLMTIPVTAKLADCEIKAPPLTAAPTRETDSALAVLQILKPLQLIHLSRQKQQQLRE